VYPEAAWYLHSLAHRCWRPIGWVRRARRSGDPWRAGAAHCQRPPESIRCYPAVRDPRCSSSIKAGRLDPSDSSSACRPCPPWPPCAAAAARDARPSRRDRQTRARGLPSSVRDGWRCDRAVRGLSLRASMVRGGDSRERAEYRRQQIKLGRRSRSGFAAGFRWRDLCVRPELALERGEAGSAFRAPWQQPCRGNAPHLG